MVSDRFVDPKTKIELSTDDNGDMYYLKGNQRIKYKNYGGIYDFVSNNNLTTERAHYDSRYTKAISKHLTIKECYERWVDKTVPENAILLDSLGGLSGKKILLLGNGTSFKELYFLHLGAKIVYTDLSLEAVKFMKDLFSSSELKAKSENNIEFHAVDALYLPFPNASIDIIYGYAFVHHIENLDSFFCEVNRCLKKGGICRFLDDAYSPVWQFMKNSFLKPLQLYSHKKTGISPEDLKATRKGGFRKDEILKICSVVKKELNFKKEYRALNHLDEMVQSIKNLF